MRFWVFMVLINLLIPALMIFFGRVFIKNAPKNINLIFGYRTARSMKNKDTWEFAHKYIGNFWFIIGLILIPITVIPMLFVIGKDTDTIATVGFVISMISLVFLIAPIFPTEAALKRNFDKDGNRI